MPQVLIDLSDDALIRAIEANAVDGCLTWGAWGGMEIRRERGLVWTLTDVPFPLFNNVLEADLSARDADDAIRYTVQTCGDRNVPLAWWLGPSSRPTDLPDRLARMGFEEVGSPIGMAVALDDLPAPAVPDGVTIERVTSEEELAEWVSVMAPVYDFPDFAADAWGRMYLAAGLDDASPWRHQVARLKGRVVATVSVLESAGVAGISSLATLSKYRGRGIAAALTCHALAESRRNGHRIGVLCSSELAQGLYRRLGFRELVRMGVWIWSGEESG